MAECIWPESVRRLEDITEALWSARVSAGTVSRLNQKVYAQIDGWWKRPLEMSYPYVYLDGIYLKRNLAGNFEDVAILIATAVNEEGERLFARTETNRSPFLTSFA